MHRISFWKVPALVVLLVPGMAGAQLPGTPGGRNRTPDDVNRGLQFNIKRRTVRGTVKSVDSDKKLLVVQAGQEKAKDVLIDVGPSRIRAGRGQATVADIKPGDKISVYGESMVQGGLRAMEITLPKERMSIAPPEKPKKVKRTPAEKEADRKAAAEQRATRKAEAAEKRATEKKEAAEKRATEKQEAAVKREAKKRLAEEKRAAKQRGGTERAPTEAPVVAPDGTPREETTPRDETTPQDEKPQPE